MKVNLFKIKGSTLSLKVTKRFKAKKYIIPIGCDCHPAYMFDKVGLRYESLPFDWLDTEPLPALQYVYENINNNFEYFIGNLKKNKEEKVFASKYPEALFFHFDNLIIDIKLQAKFRNRIKRLLEITKHKSCYFVHNTKSEAFNTRQDVKNFVDTISDFSRLLKPSDELLIYLRFDETLNENRQNCELLLDYVKTIKTCKIVTYIRHEKKYGIWGDERKYNDLIKALGIEVKTKFPKIELFKKTN